MNPIIYSEMSQQQMNLFTFLIGKGAFGRIMMGLGRKPCLIIMIVLTTCLFFVELVVGNMTSSVTLVADSFHMLSDIVSLLVGYFSLRISQVFNHIILLFYCLSIMSFTSYTFASTSEKKNDILHCLPSEDNSVCKVVGYGIFLSS